MPKKTEHPWFMKNIKFPGEFTETYDKFALIIKIDPDVQSKITNHQKASGIESLGIRVAMEEYVQRKYVLYLQQLREKAVKSQVGK